MVFGEQMRDDIVVRLLNGEPDLETSRFLDRLMELSTLEEAEHQLGRQVQTSDTSARSPPEKVGEPAERRRCNVGVPALGPAGDCLLYTSDAADE